LEAVYLKRADLLLHENEKYSFMEKFNYRNRRLSRKVNIRAKYFGNVMRG